MITFGICVTVTSVLDVVLVHRENGWRAALLVHLIPGVGPGNVHGAQASRWLAQQNQKEGALEMYVGNPRKGARLDRAGRDCHRHCRGGKVGRADVVGDVSRPSGAALNNWSRLAEATAARGHERLHEVLALIHLQNK